MFIPCSPQGLPSLFPLLRTSPSTSPRMLCLPAGQRRIPATSPTPGTGRMRTSTSRSEQHPAPTLSHGSPQAPTLREGPWQCLGTRSHLAAAGGGEGTHCYLACIPANIPLLLACLSLFCSDLKLRVRILIDGTLIIFRVKPEDAGKYTCVPSNSLGRSPSASAYLTVQCE